eukprot:SAG31_NODE_249_length_19118_cov_47.456195_13_plen_138_part_00
MRVLYAELFDIGGVLRGSKPWSAMVGAREMLVLICSILGSIIVLDQYNLMLRRLAATIYLRDADVFRRQIIFAAALSFGQGTMKTTSRHMLFMLIQKWRHELSHTLHVKVIYALSICRAAFFCRLCSLLGLPQPWLG